MIPHTADNRVLFAVPWHGRVVVGTTDTPVDTVSPEPRPLDAEVDFLLSHAARYLVRHPDRSDVLSVFAGLRPLVRPGGAGETSLLSREHVVLLSSSGLVTIAGGKWTTYRRMGEDAVNQAAAVAGLAERPSVSAGLRIHGWQEGGAEIAPWDVYGADAAGVRELCRGNPAWDDELHPDLPYRMGEVVWAVRREWARTVEDVLARRTRALFLDARASMAAAPRVAELMALELERDEAWEAAQVAEYCALARGYLPA
jgi:glycerol-3-phosphate dehydrogenase